MTVNNTSFADCCGLSIIYGFQFRSSSVASIRDQKAINNPGRLEELVKNELALQKRSRDATIVNYTRWVSQAEEKLALAEAMPNLKSGKPGIRKLDAIDLAKSTIEYYKNRIEQGLQWDEKALTIEATKRLKQTFDHHGDKQSLLNCLSRERSNGRGGAMVVLNPPQKAAMHDMMLAQGAVVMFDGLYNPNHRSHLTGYMFVFHPNESSEDGFIGQTSNKELMS